MPAQRPLAEQAAEPREVDQGQQQRRFTGDGDD